MKEFAWLKGLPFMACTPAALKVEGNIAISSSIIKHLGVRG